MTTATGSDPGTQYHYILTLQRPNGRGAYEIATARGTVHVTPGATRAEALDYALGLVNTKRGWGTDEGTILFFALEPNDLTGSAT